METNKLLGLIGMLVSIGLAVYFLVLLLPLPPPTAGLGITGVTLVAFTGLVLSLVGIIKGSSGFAITGIIVSVINIIYIALGIMHIFIINLR